MEQKLKIMVVDDEWSVRELLRNLLCRHGFEVLLVKDALEFSERVSRESPDAIILDIMLGDDDGTRVYDKLVHLGILSKDIPVVFLSGLAEGRPVEMPQSGRRYSLVGKPFDTHKLVAFLKESLAASG